VPKRGPYDRLRIQIARKEEERSDQNRTILSDPPETSNFKLGMTSKVLTKSSCAFAVVEINCFVFKSLLRRYL
jgi:hypothetical protein